MNYRLCSCLLMFIPLSLSGLYAQVDRIVIGETMEEYIKENHIDKIEGMVHELAHSKAFINQFLEKENQINSVSEKIKKSDVGIGKDVDIYVKHITDHQNFTMILVPISIYSMAIYDTILFSVLEVSDMWLERQFPYENIENDSIKSNLLSRKNHDMLAAHVYDQALSRTNSNMGAVSLEFDETFISTNTVHEDLSKFSNKEKKEIRRHWGILKKVFSHSVDLNIEMNVYVFGFDDIEVNCRNSKGVTTFKVTPGNIFVHHTFKQKDER